MGDVIIPESFKKLIARLESLEERQAAALAMTRVNLEAARAMAAGGLAPVKR